MSTSPRVVFANIGAEERTLPALGAGTPVARLAAAFDDVVRDPPWSFLAGARGLVPWLVTAEAEATAARTGLAVCFCAASTVRAVHDKAFALEVAQAEALGNDDDLTPLARAFDPADAASDIAHTAARVAEDVQRHVAGWPAWARERFTLKPRMGTSGRGRVAGREGRLDDAGRAGLRNLLRRSGFILEPFVARTFDVSTLFVVDDEARVVFVGSTRQEVTETGVYRGCTARWTADGAWEAGTPDDARAREDAAVVVRAAAARGFRGFCGVDAFAWRDGASLRSAVELNARFTAGHIALALMARQRARLRATALRFSLADDVLVTPSD